MDPDDLLFTDTYDSGSVRETADYVQAELTSPDDVIALPILNGTSPTDRANLIDHYEAVLTELRRRGFPVHAYTLPKPDGVALVIARN